MKLTTTLILMLASIFLNGTETRGLNFTVSTITCNETVGDCIGNIFDATYGFLDTLGFFQAFYGLVLLTYHSTITMLTYSTVQFFLFWLTVCAVVCMLLRPFLRTLWCLCFPCRKLVAVTVAPIKRRIQRLSRAEQNHWRHFLAQGDGASDKVETSTPAHDSETTSLSRALNVVPDKVGGLSIPCVEAKVEKPKDTKKDNCATETLNTKNPADGICGSVNYGLSSNTGKPIVRFKVPTTFAKYKLTDKIYNRMTRVNLRNPINWTAGQPFGTVLWSASINDLLINNAVFKQLKARCALMRFDMRFVLVPVCNNNALGSVVLMYQHYGQAGFQSTSGVFANSIASIGTFNHVWLQAASDESAILEVPWNTPALFNDGNLNDLDMMGSVTLGVAHPLSLPAGLSTTLQFELHMQLVNIYGVLNQVPLYATQGLIDINYNDFEEVNDSTLMLDKKGDTLTATIPVGLDHPGDTRQPPAMLRRVFPKTLNTRGTLDVVRATFNGCDNTYRKLEGQDEMDISYLFQCENIVGSFTLNSGSTKGNLLWQMVPHPAYVGNTGTPTVHNALTTLGLGFVYDECHITVKIPKAAYQNGKLLITLTQGIVSPTGNVISAPASLTVAYEMLSAPGMTIDLNSCDFEHTFIIPWASMTEFTVGSANLGQVGNGFSMYFGATSTAKTFQYTLPLVAIYTLIPPQASPNISGTVNALVGMKFTKCRIVYPQQPGIIVQGKSTTVDMATKSQYLKGIDDCVSLRQTWAQPWMLTSGYINGAENMYYSMLNITTRFPLTSLYSNFSGSIRWMMCFSHWQCDYVVIEHVLWDNVVSQGLTPPETDGLAMDSFLNYTGSLAATAVFNSATYTPSWKGAGGTNRMVMVEKGTPFVIFETPIVRPNGFSSIYDTLGGQFIFSCAGATTTTNTLHTEIYVMAGDDFRASHIVNGVNALVADAVGSVQLPPWRF